MSNVHDVRFTQVKHVEFEIYVSDSDKDVVVNNRADFNELSCTMLARTCRSCQNDHAHIVFHNKFRYVYQYYRCAACEREKVAYTASEQVLDTNEHVEITHYLDEKMTKVTKDIKKAKASKATIRK